MFLKEQTHLGIKQKLIELETQFKVDEWKVNDIYVWPYIRIKLYFLLLTNSNSNSEIEETNVEFGIIERSNSSIFFSKIKILHRLVLSFIKTESFFFLLKKKKIIFFGSHIHRVKHGEEHFSRFFDSMVAFHNLEKDVYMVEHQKLYISNYNPSAIIKLEPKIQDYMLLEKLKTMFTNHKTEIFLDGFEDFLLVLNKDIINAKSLRITERDLVFWIQKIQNIASFFYRMLFRVRPNKIILPGYYGRDNLYAAVLAANQLGIRTIDFQHGPQTNIHMVFTAWNKIPSVGYNVMPTEYWTWDEKSKQNIENWSAKTTTVSVKNVGQPYLEYWRLKNIEIITNQKTVLYSLQLMPLSEMLNEAIVKLIDQSESLWQIRLHPRNEFSKSDIVKHLEYFGVDQSRYTIHDSREIPLPEILSMTFLHVTAFSGCLIEAKMTGIPSIIINNIGREIYEDYIDNNLVYYLDQKRNNFETDFFKLYTKFKESKYTVEARNIVNPTLS
jgi:hypothetical protein